MRFRERNILAYGHLLVEVFRKGKRVDRISGPNVVINNGKIHILRLMGGITGFTPISRMEVGDGGCGLAPPVSALLTPIAFTATDTGLRSSILYVVNNQAVNPLSPPTGDLDQAGKTLRFIATFDSASANPANYHFSPKVINEFALKSGVSDNAIIALRATRSIPFDPTDAVSVRATWTLGLT